MNRIRTAVATIAITCSGCSIPVDQRTTALEQGAFPDELTATTTTTTTPTTTSTSAPAPEASVPTESTTTTMAPIPVEPVTVYFARGLTDVMQAVEIVRPIGTPVLELIELLERPSGITEAGLRTTVLPGLIDDIVVDRGTATVVLDRTVLDRMSNTNQQRAIAQIVLTVTSFRTVDAGGIGRIRFEVDRTGFPVFVPAFGGTSDPGEELSFTDFQSLIATTPTPAVTTTTSLPTTTTVPSEPPSSDPPDGSTEEPIDESG
ncbi:MAG: GerMN domain-containing protein [Ilumatobacteraceae bacterium]